MSNIINKPVINITGWSIWKHNTCYYISGIADNHPKLGKNIQISSSSEILDISFNRNNVEDESELALIIETRNSIYMAKLKFISTVCNGFNDLPTERSDKETGEVKELLWRYSSYSKLALMLKDKTEKSVNKVIKENEKLFKSGLDVNEFRNLIKLSIIGDEEIKAEKERADFELLNKVLEYENAIYIELSSISKGNSLAYNIGEKTGILSPQLHIGMIQDSVLYTDELLDFRYFPQGLTLETYVISESIKKVVIKNLKGYEISINNICIKPNELKVIDASKLK